MTTKHHNGLTFKLLYDQVTIANVIAKLALQINEYYAQVKQSEGTLDLVVVCMLKGAFMFYSDLVKLIHFEHRNLFIKASSYQGMESKGELLYEIEPQLEDYQGKTVLVVQDMHDTGNTLKKLLAKIQTLNPKRVDAAVLVKRPDRPLQVDLKFWGLECGDFIIGYGLDWNEFGRSFPEIYQKI